MPTNLDIQKTLRNVNQYIEDLSIIVEERQNLVDLIHLKPSLNDNYELILLLGKIVKYLDYAYQDISQHDGADEDASTDLKTLFCEAVTEYRNIMSCLENDVNINIQEYLYKPRPFHEPKLLKPQKLVRFHNDVAEISPYRNSPITDEFSDSDSLNVQSSQQIFAQHLQALLEQDASLDLLHDSISRQHQMGTLLGNEVDDQLIILNDLEYGVDYLTTRLSRASNGLTRFNKMCRKNGNMVTIFILIVILVFLLLVLS